MEQKNHNMMNRILKNTEHFSCFPVGYLESGNYKAGDYIPIN